MALEVLSSAKATDAILTNGTTPVALLDQVTISAPGGDVQFTAYAEGAYTDSGTVLQILVDGVVMGQHNAFSPMELILTLSAGSHTVDYQVISNYFDVNLRDRGLVILSLA